MGGSLISGGRSPLSSGFSFGSSVGGLVAVGTEVCVSVGVREGVLVGVFVGIGLGVGVEVSVRVRLGVKVRVGGDVGVIVGVFVALLINSWARIRIWDDPPDAKEKDGVPNQTDVAATRAKKIIIQGYRKLVFRRAVSGGELTILTRGLRC
jgi:hypothetical protein